MSTAADTTAVTNLITTYAELVDAGDFTGVGALFANATFTSSGTTITGGENLEKMFRATVILYDDGTPRTHHATTNIAIEFDDESHIATARSYFTVFQALPDLPLQPIAAGRYIDHFTRLDNDWSFMERQVHITLAGNLSHHLRTEPRRIAAED
ncbi:nuclear transport factor 2 family protein [Nocardia aurantiaca]|uniref:Nuclear transport factor 2 family protein n=1 Tax=Nocardia aurantiaca TaxID=2675850 RepID=A0A6I3L6S6_9NOCA|nr:nuclear transport factor 2 family protein [Nocardia aurantiaca]MTE17201.1 nuclear transport factor 2 family protein [Nocardia aurantiaca]